MIKQYDLIAIGTGTGASGAASRCRSAGWSVAVIDHLPFGGTCALRGCDPKKVLVGVAEAIDHSRRMRGKGIAGGESAIAWNELIKFKRTFTEPVPAMKEKSFTIRRRGADASRRSRWPLSRACFSLKPTDAQSSETELPRGAERRLHDPAHPR